MNVVAMPSAAVPSMKDRVSEAEWETRVQLAALYRIDAYMGLEDLRRTILRRARLMRRAIF